MEKVLVEIFFTYGKRDGEELGENFVETDSRELREGVLEEWASGSLCIDGDVEAFKEGSLNRLYADRDGGDWDEPTGVYIVLSSYIQKKAELARKYNADLAKLNRQFKVEEN